MKSLNLIFLLSVVKFTAFAQQSPQYTQYVFNNFLINPAISGIENYTDIKLSHRNQWTGLNGAPVTNYLSVHAPIGRRFLASSAAENDRRYMRLYSAAEPHHGIGMHVVSDKVGLMNRLDVSGTYAFHIGLSGTANLAVGAAAGLTSLSLDVSKITTDNFLDPAISASASRQMKPQLSLGAWLYGSRYFIGVSAHQLLGQSLSFSDNVTYKQSKLVPHLFFTAGYKFLLGADIIANPSVLLKKVSAAPGSYDTNLKLAFKEKFWIGGSYRHQDSFSAVAGFNVSHLFNLGYSYDFTTSALRTVSNGSHEIVLGLLLNNRDKVVCPQRYW